jgi:hypothetical protein
MSTKELSLPIRPNHIEGVIRPSAISADDISVDLEHDRDGFISSTESV